MRKAHLAALLVFTTLVMAVLSCGTKIENAIPGININLPSLGSTLKVGETIEIVSTASGEAGIAQVTLSIDGQVVNIATPPQGNPTTFAAIQAWRPDTEGKVRVTVIAQDVDGKESEPASIELVVVSQVEVTVTPSITLQIPPTEPSPDACSFDAAIVEDVTIPDSLEMSPGQTFTKIWRILNSGTCDWPLGTQLSMHRGDQLQGPPIIPVPALEAGSMADISIEITAPAAPRHYSWIWSLITEDGPSFGPYFIVAIVVPEVPTPTYTPYITTTTTPPTPDGPTPTRTPYITPTYTPHANAQIQRVGNQATLAPDDLGHVVVSCPEGSIVTSGGFTTNPEVLVYTQSKSENGWQVYGVNNSDSEKLLHVYATCLSNTNGFVSQIYDQVAAPAGGIGHGNTTCPAGSVVTGGGWASNADGGLSIYNSSKSGNGWQVYVRNTGNTEKFFNTYAICLSGTNGVTNQSGDKVSITAGSTGAVKAVCENDALITGGGFAANTEFYVYDTSLEKGSSTTWWTYAINPTGASQLLGSYAICITFP